MRIARRGFLGALTAAGGGATVAATAPKAQVADFFPAGMALDLRARTSTPPDLYRDFILRSKIVRVTVDGQDVSSDCFAFDERAGWAELYARNERGEFWTYSDGLMTCRVFGKVQAIIENA